MGKASRWFRGLLGMKKEKENVEKEKKKCSIGKSGKDGGQNIPGNIPVSDGVWLRLYNGETENEQNKHAMAVAAATAAAADAAVVAAQAAVAVVRLTNHGRGVLFNGGREKLAAIKIQIVFRGYLARKALRALKGLVKLQALVRGYLVRKQAAATLHRMQALFRAQTAVRSERARRSITNDNRNQPEMRARKSIERFDETRNEFHSKRLSGSYESSFNGYDESSKIVEIDTFKPRSRSRRISTCMSDSGDDHQHYQAMSSPLHPCPMPARLSIPDCRHLQDFDWSFLGDGYKFRTANNTPRFARSNAPVTPAKSIGGDSFFQPYSNHPSYMANTRSSWIRSRSAPKQRPETGPKKRLSLNEIMASRSSFSGVRMQHHSSCPNVQEDLEI